MKEAKALVAELDKIDNQFRKLSPNWFKIEVPKASAIWSLLGGKAVVALRAGANSPTNLKAMMGPADKSETSPGPKQRSCPVTNKTRGGFVPSLVYILCAPSFRRGQRRQSSYRAD